MNAPNQLHWTLNSCFGVLHSVWAHLGSFRNYMKLHETTCESSCQEVMSGFFSTNAPYPPYWILNSCFGVLHSVWVHLGSFRNYMKLDAKQGELVQLMQKFLPRSRIGIFLYERTQSTPLDPKLKVWCVA